MASVFMSRTEKSVMNKKLVGVHIPKKDAHRFALLSLEHNIPRTEILLPIINEFLDQVASYDTMVKSAAQRAFSDWEEKGKSSQAEIKTFCTEIRHDLKTHRLEPELIEEIIKGFTKLL